VSNLASLRKAIVTREATAKALQTRACVMAAPGRYALDQNRIALPQEFQRRRRVCRRSTSHA
jgi:hypothetical protein